jgi:hypothetical protein
MSIISEKNRSHEEEIKRKLKLKEVMSQIKILKPEKDDVSKAEPILKVKDNIDKTITEMYRLSRLELKPIVGTEGVRLTPREPKREISVKSIEHTIIPNRVKELKIDLKPKIPKIEVKQPEVLKLDRIITREITIEELQLSPKRLRETSSDVRTISPVGFIIKRSMPPMSLTSKKLKKVPLDEKGLVEKEGERIIIEEREIVAPKAEEPSKLFVEEEIFIPPFIRELSIVAKNAIMDTPICVVLPKRSDDSFINSVAIITREIYRIVKGGKPGSRWISEGLKEEIERYLRAEDMIFIIDDSKSILLPEFNKILFAREFLEKVNIELLIDRLREFFSQHLGFLIFHVNERWASKFAELLREKAWIYVKKENIIKVPSPNWPPQVKKELAKILWDFVEGEGDTFDEIFADSEEKFLKELRYIDKDLIFHWIKEDKSAGEEHENMKAIVVECLAKELGAKNRDEIIQMLKDNVIETECELDSGRRADICIKKFGIDRYIEIETFYGTGDPIRKLDKETLSKYIEKKDVRIDIVLLTGIQMLLYAKELIRLAKLYEREHGLRVGFYIPNIRERRLISLEQVLSELKKIFNFYKPAKGLTKEDIEQLWNKFSEALRQHDIDPEQEDFRKIFETALDYSKSYEENLYYIMKEAENEIKSLKKIKENN